MFPRILSLTAGLMVALLFFAGALSPGRAAAARKPASASQRSRVLIIGLDGTTGNQLHYRALVQGAAPTFKKLMESGEFAACIDLKHPNRGGHRDRRCARAHHGPRTGSGYEWLTGSGWASVLTGVDNLKHGVRNNRPASLSTFSKSSRLHPTIMKIARDAGLVTAAGGVPSFLSASVHGQFHPGIIDYECGSGSDDLPSLAANAGTSCNLTHREGGNPLSVDRDRKLTAFLQKQIEDSRTDLVMGVYDRIDAAGHQSGFSSNSHYLSVITETDALVAALIAAVEKRAAMDGEAWMVLVTADHGGHQVGWWGTHGSRRLEDDAIPFIVKTFGWQGELQPLTYPVSHMDVVPTVARWLGVTPPPGLDGHVQALPP